MNNLVMRIGRITCLGLTVQAVVLSEVLSPVWAAEATARARLRFNLGVVDVDLYGNEAPLTATNFLDNHVNTNNYDDSIVHRSSSGNTFFVQGGSFGLPSEPIVDEPGLQGVILSNPVDSGDEIPNEYDESNGLSNTEYSLSGAIRQAGGTSQSGWFINVSDNSSAFDWQQFTIFGEVVAGTDVLDAIVALPKFAALSGDSFLESTPNYNGGLVILQQAWQIPLLAGDYDLDNDRDGEDYDKWVADFGEETELVADGNDNGTVDAPDYNIWRDNRLLPAAAQRTVSTTPVPEPASISLLLGALLAWAARFGTRQRKC